MCSLPCLLTSQPVKEAGTSTTKSDPNSSRNSARRKQKQKVPKVLAMLRISPDQNPSMTTCSPTTSSATTCLVDDQNSSIYARAWRFVQRRLHLRPRASSCPADVETAKAREEGLVVSDWQRVHMLKELEGCQECITETAEWTLPTDTRAPPRFRTQAQQKVAQITCYNCGRLFFRPLSVARDTSSFCGRDCQSTFEYRRGLQDVVNECETFQAAVHLARSNDL